MRIIAKTLAATLVISICASLAAQAAPPAAGPAPGQQPAAAPVAAPATSPGVKPGSVAATPAAKPAVAPAVTPAAAPAPAAKIEKPALPPTSVIERFRTYSGPRTPAALSELFSAPYSAGMLQMPAIVLSNGAEMIRIAMALPAQGNTATNFALNGARMMSSTLIKKDEWLIEALPETGVMKAELLVLSNGSTLEIPLAVAPPLSASTDLSEKGFITFLGGDKPAATPLQDLNGDGRRDYLDDYIFTANYLVSKRTGPLTPPVETTEEPRVEKPNLADTEAGRRLLDLEAAGASEKNSGEGQGAWQPASGGGIYGVGTPATGGGTPATGGGTPTTGGGTPIAGGGTTPPVVVTPPPDSGTPPPDSGTPTSKPKKICRTSAPVVTHDKAKNKSVMDCCDFYLEYLGVGEPSAANMRNCKARFNNP